MNTAFRILAIITMATLPSIGHPVVAVDGTVDPGDYIIWQNSTGPINFAPADESVIVSFSIQFPGDSRMAPETLVTYDIGVFDQNGVMVGSTVVEAPLAGFGLVDISATDVTPENALLIINKLDASTVELFNNHNRVALQVIVSRRAVGRNPHTGETIKIRAKPGLAYHMRWSVTIVGSDGNTRATTGTVKGLMSKGFGFIAPSDGGD